jgi:fructokinase
MDVPVIAGIGEILFDVLHDSEELGGAPINFAYHVNSLGAKGYAVSTIGDDARGRKALAELQRRQLSTECITVTDRYPTGYVQAHLDEAGIATYDFPDDTAWDHLTVNEHAIQLAGHLACVCFGSLVQRSEVSRKELVRFLELTPSSTLKVFDLNLRQNFYSKEVVLQSLHYADVLKLNDDELPVLASMLSFTGDDRSILAAVVSEFNLKLVALTRGGKGSLLVTPKKYSDHPGIRAEKIADTIGAGDAFTAATVISFLKGYELDRINEKANRVAAWVCSQKGAMPVMPTSFRM